MEICCDNCRNNSCFCHSYGADFCKGEEFKPKLILKNIKDMVKDKTVKFSFYRNKELWYVTEDGFEFPVPISDTGNGVFNDEDKAIRFMRWIRKHLENIEVARSDVPLGKSRFGLE